MDKSKRPSVYKNESGKVLATVDPRKENSTSQAVQDLTDSYTKGYIEAPLYIAHLHKLRERYGVEVDAQITEVIRQREEDLLVELVEGKSPASKKFWEDISPGKR